MPRAKEHGSLTGSKRYKAEKDAKEANSVGARAKKLAEKITGDLGGGKTASNSPTATPTATATNTPTSTTTTATTATTATGFTNGYASAGLVISDDAYGGIQFPTVDFTKLVPTDLLNPENLAEIQVSEEQLTKGLSLYAGATRAMELYNAGFTYISKVGQAKQSMHKAQSSVIKSATEEVKVKQNIVKFDIANVELATEQEKLLQANEGLKQEQLKTVAAQNETEQLKRKLVANEGKRDAEIRRVVAQTNDIVQKYLKESIANVA